jgi:2,5-diketo-D-gluconate reductase A
MYGNEQGVGEAVALRASTGPRCSSPASSTTASTVPTTPAGLRRTLEALGFDYVDLFLIHWPLPTLYDGDFVSTWKCSSSSARDGRARSIGVSNFQPAHLDRLATDETEVVPAVNQIEIHPYLTQDDLRRHYDAEPRDRHRGLVADRPGPGPRRPGHHRRWPRRSGKTPAQVVLRWHIQRGTSCSRSR